MDAKYQQGAERRYFGIKPDLQNHFTETIAAAASPASNRENWGVEGSARKSLDVNGGSVVGGSALQRLLGPWLAQEVPGTTIAATICRLNADGPRLERGKLLDLACRSGSVQALRVVLGFVRNFLPSWPAYVISHARSASPPIGTSTVFMQSFYLQ